MKLETRHRPAAAGYSMVELVVVVGLIIVMAAVAIPNIAGYMKTYRLRGATQEVSSELQVARNKAIVKNTNRGVAFAILDANSYRINILDDEGIPATGAGLTALRDLPQGVFFVPASTTPSFGVGFDRLGRRCALNSAGCAPTQTVGTMCMPTHPRCSDTAAGNFLDTDPTDPTTIRVRVREQTTGLERWIRIAPGGRVLNQR
jgi:type II secretory pathway pseudopilin PulG